MKATRQRGKLDFVSFAPGLIGLVVVLGAGSVHAFGFSGSAQLGTLLHSSFGHLGDRLTYSKRLCNPVREQALRTGVRNMVAFKVAISAGRGGTRALALGVKIDEVLRASEKMEGVCLEAQLRKASLAKLECRMDDIYHDEPLDYNDRDSLALHAASGMKVTSGCPMHLIHGVKGGCEACKCRVPSMKDVKKYCAYYGTGRSAIAPRTAWAMHQELKAVLSQCSALVILSGNEDISGNPDYPAAREIASYQTKLINDAKEQGVGFILLVGPSDDVEGGAKSRTAQIKRDVALSEGLNRAVKQLGGLEVAEDERTEERPGMGKLLAERYLESAGMPYSVIRAPLKLFKTTQLAHVALQALQSGASNKQILVQGLPGFVDEEEQEFKARVAAQRRAAAAAPLNGDARPAARHGAVGAESVQRRQDFFVTEQTGQQRTEGSDVPSAEVIQEVGSHVEGDVALNEPVGGATWEEFD